MHNYIIGAYNAGRALDALMGLKELDENGRKVARILLQLCYDDENKAGLISVLRGSHLKGYKSNARKMMFVVDFFENGPTLE